MVSMKCVGMAVATVAGLSPALPSPAQQQRTMRIAPAWYFGAGAGVGITGTGRADLNLFSVSGMIRF